MAGWEELEQEEQDQGGPLVDDECLGAAEPDAGLDQDSQEETDVFEAFQAGWKAKMKAGEKRKARGYRVVPAGSAKSGVASSGGKSLALKKKKSSTCASCGGKGHWRGDPECPNVQNGQDALHRPASSTSHSANEVNFVNFTFMVGTLAECPSCGNFCDEEAAFCSKCGARLNKRDWTVVSDPPSDARTSVPAPPRPMRLELPKTAVGKTHEKDKKVKLKPLEVLGAVDKLSKEEKKAIRTLLQEEETEAAWASLETVRPYAHEAGAKSSGDFAPPVRPRPEDERRARDQLPVRPRSDHGAVYNEPLRPPGPKDAWGRDKAKAVKQEELDDFRHELHNRQCEGDRCVPSGAAPRPSENQARCRHQFADLLWTANQHGHFARCSRCDLKHVIYYSVRHGVLMVNQVLENAGPDPEAGPIWTPGLAVAETGCRTSVGGVRWHQAYQAELRRRGVTWQTVEEKETFQFGSGSPVTSKRAFLYPVALVPGQVDVLRMSEVDGQAASCPGLVGPSELSRWSVQFDFRTRELVILDNRQPMHLTPTRHPALDLVTYLPEGDPRKQPGMLEKARLLRQAPQSLAFVAAAPATMGHDFYLQDTSEEPTEEERSADQSGTHDTGGTGVGEAGKMKRSGGWNIWRMILV